MVTAQRPVPLPPTGVRAEPQEPRQPRKPLPAGAVAWSRSYLDPKGVPQKADELVPVDADGYRTKHQRHTCGKHLAGADGKRYRCDRTMWLLPDEPAQYCPDHGQKLASAEVKQATRSAVPWGKIARAVEPSARPLWVLAAEFAAGIGEFAGHISPWLPVAVTPLLAGGAYSGVRLFLTGRARRRGRVEKGQATGRRVQRIRRRARSAGYLGAAAGGWLSVAAAVEPTTAVGRLVWLSILPAWAAGSYPWWRYQDSTRGQRDTPEVAMVETPEEPPVEPAALTDDEAAALEATRTWAQDGFPGTALDAATWQRIPCGWQVVITATKRGALVNLFGDNVKTTTRKIAGIFDVPKSAITLIEEHEDSPNRALLLVQPSNPLRDGQIWAGPDTIRVTQSRITAEVGRFIDGAPMLETLFRFDEGMPSELVLGTTGSGKSERLRLKLVIRHWASFLDQTGQRRGLFLTFLHDPKRLNSYGEFRDAVHGYGITRDDAHLMIDAFLREMVRRYDMLRTTRWVDSKGRARVGSVKWNPLVHGPLFEVIWDEFHELAEDKEFVKKLEKLARYQRACGMGSTLASHMGTIGDTGSQALRDMLSGGRASLLRTTSGLNASLATGGQLTADPRGLPKAPGMVLVADGEAATLMGRYAFIPDDKLAARLDERPLYDWLFDDNNRPIGYPAEIPAETAEAFGPEFMQWMEAGRRPEGRPDTGPGAAPIVKAVAPDAEAGSADEALRLILSTATGPMARKDIAEDARWRYGVTSTLTACLRRGQDAKPPWLRKLANGLYELTPAERERLQAARDEEAEEAA